MALPFFVNDASGATDYKSGRWLEATLPNAPQAGDTIIAKVVFFNCPGMASLVSGWTQIFSQGDSSDSVKFYRRTAGVGESSTISLGSITNTGADGAWCHVFVYRDADPSNPIHAIASTAYFDPNTNSNNLVAPALTVTKTVDVLLVASFGSHRISTLSGSITHFGVPSGMTQRRRDISFEVWSNVIFHANARLLYDQTLSSTGGTGTRTVTRSTNYHLGNGFLLALQGVSGRGPLIAGKRNSLLASAA